MTHIPAVAVAEPLPAPPVHDPIDWDLAERVARRFSGREPLAASYLAGSLRADFDAVTAEAEALVADYTGLRSPGPARAQVVDRASWVVGQRLVDAPPARAAHRAGRRTHGRQPGRAHRPPGRRHRDRGAARVPRPAGARPVRPARARRRRCRRRRLLRRRQHPRAGEALRVPAPRLPALDRDPRGHAPGAVHRGALDEALLPVAGREHAVVDRSRPAPAGAGARPAPPRSSAAGATRSTTAASSRCSPATSSAARSPTCRRSCRCSRATATA